MRGPVILAALILAQGPSALASCAYLSTSLEETMVRYRGFRDRNAAHQRQMAEKEASCKQKATEFSRKIGATAEGLSCEAQGDAARLHDEAWALGLDCEKVFSEIQAAQAALVLEFEVVHDDVKQALAFMHTDRLLKLHCAEEITVTGTMAEAFLQMEGLAISIQRQAKAGSGDYGSLKSLASAMAGRNQALHGECGSNGDQRRTATYGQGSTTVTPIGESPRPVSDISGTQKAIDDNAKAEALIGK